MQYVEPNMDFLEDVTSCPTLAQAILKHLVEEVLILFSSIILHLMMYPLECPHQKLP